MAKLFQQIRVGTVTGDAVKAKTGKPWDQWFKILDKAGARMMEPEETALFLHDQYGIPGWWSKMVAAGYLNERGLRQDESAPPVHKREVTLSKVVLAPRAAVWAAWQDPGALARWLPDAKFEVSKTVPLKILHLDWSGQTRVVLRLYERSGKTRLVVSHGNLAEDDTERWQQYWIEALERLRLLVAR